MKVASYRHKGMFAGRVVEHRVIQGAQRWRIKVRTEREGGQIDIQEVVPLERLPMRELLSLVVATINEVCAPGEKLIDAQMDFYVEKAA